MNICVYIYIYIYIYIHTYIYIIWSKSVSTTSKISLTDNKAVPKGAFWLRPPRPRPPACSTGLFSRGKGDAAAEIVATAPAAEVE